ncbi:MAG: hypothetical protein DRN66_01465 [Candidatus Nanohalarchaeota archaeon]|nr:MAG: hypothetical protein DRN66_01465 [Candidatus Nanohaloarchaeota archaeon]
MGYLEDITKKAYSAIKENPYIALPATLIWIPSALLGIVLFLGTKNIIETNTLISIIESLKSDPTMLFYSLWAIAKDYLIYSLAILFAIIILHYYIKATYSVIAKAIHQNKPVSIFEALLESKKRIVALMITDALLILIAFMAVIAVLVIEIPICIFLGPIGIILLLFVDFFLFFAGLVYLVLLSIISISVVVLDKKSGLDAIKESYRLIKYEKLDSWLLIILVFIISSIYIFLVSAVVEIFSLLIGPYAVLVGTILHVFLPVFGYICYTLLYFHLKEKIKEPAH